ncbi:hypothetical protein [Chelativorans sp. YIM 93263]|uniref:hypothetical protein n=1 Tax=Chelativorans sp. YIM 93263 TaxID=2906648 RepID=UPI002378295E|nr:hypothetical protein [Chelativorans sp. YIM 93263]
MPEDNRKPNDNGDSDRIKPTKAQLNARRNRSIAIAVALAIFVILLYLASIMKLGPAVFDRAM